ncbi:MAG: SRPBCC family protein [Burkholderiales bacterium]
MFKTFLLSLLGLVLLAVLVVLGMAAMRPDDFSVLRSLRMAAPPEKVFALVDDLKQFNRWNPWLKKDPTTQLTYGPVTAGPGAQYAWTSEKMGAGSMTQAAATAPAPGTAGRVAFKLDFLKPFETHNTAEFTFQPEGGTTTTVTWTMRGPMPFISKVMDVVVGMDSMIGPDFEAGLAELQKLAEQP